MAATALIKFTQGAHTDVAGRAVLGEYEDFSAVSVTNGDNTDVVEWTIYLLDAPPDSATYDTPGNPRVLATAVNNTPSTTFNPDVSGSYRIMLEVRDALAQIDRDIRVFGIPDADGVVRPPYQKGPDPLPVALPIIIAELPRPIKPDEQNYGTNERGWAGDRNSGQLEYFFERHRDLPFLTVTSTPFTAVLRQPPLYLVDLPTIGGSATFNLPLSPRNGYVARIVTLGAPNIARRLTVAPQGGGSIMSFSTVEMLGESDAEFVHVGSNAWVARGGQHLSLERTLVGGAASTDLTTWVMIGAISIDPADFLNISNTASWRVAAFTTDAADPTEVRLFNVTAASVVAGSTLNFDNLLPIQKTASISLVAGANVYEAQMRLSVTGSPNLAVCTQALFILDSYQL